MNGLESPSLKQFIYRAISTDAPVSQNPSLFKLPFLTFDRVQTLRVRGPGGRLMSGGENWRNNDGGVRLGTGREIIFYFVQPYEKKVKIIRKKESI